VRIIASSQCARARAGAFTLIANASRAVHNAACVFESAFGPLGDQREWRIRVVVSCSGIGSGPHPGRALCPGWQQPDGSRAGFCAVDPARRRCGRRRSSVPGDGEPRRALDLDEPGELVIGLAGRRGLPRSPRRRDAKAVNGSKILVVGVAYKPDVSDVRESPAFDVIDGLLRLGADVVRGPSRSRGRRAGTRDEERLTNSELRGVRRRGHRHTPSRAGLETASR
jgi:UDP-glucose/GDP-mannose dehydrogenase family protein